MAENEEVKGVFFSQSLLKAQRHKDERLLASAREYEGEAQVDSLKEEPKRRQRLLRRLAAGALRPSRSSRATSSWSCRSSTRSISSYEFV